MSSYNLISEIPISATALILSILSSGLTIFLLNTSSDPRQCEQLRHSNVTTMQENEQRFSHTICFTNSTEKPNRTKIRRPLAVHSYKMAENMTVFITNEDSLLPDSETLTKCISLRDKVFYLCCPFWPSMPQVRDEKETTWQFEYSLVIEQDTSFQPSHIIYGKQNYIIEKPRLILKTDGRKDIVIDTEYITRETVADPYPEIHIRITVHDEETGSLNNYIADWFI